MDSQKSPSGNKITKISQSVEKYTKELENLIAEIERVEKPGAVEEEAEKNNSRSDTKDKNQG